MRLGSTEPTAVAVEQWSLGAMLDAAPIAISPEFPGGRANQVGLSGDSTGRKAA